MRKKQVPQEAILPLEERIRVADFLLLLITIDKRISLEAKAKKAAKAADKATKNDVDTGSRLLRAFFIFMKLFWYLKKQYCYNFLFLGANEIFIE